MKKYKTPYNFSDINDEIYQDENPPIIFDNSKNISYRNNSIGYTNENKKTNSQICLEQSKKLSINKIVGFSINSTSSNKNLNKKIIFKNENLSISSPFYIEISAQYENISKLTDFKYIKDMNLKSKIIDFIKIESNNNDIKTIHTSDKYPKTARNKQTNSSKINQLIKNAYPTKKKAVCFKLTDKKWTTNLLTQIDSKNSIVNNETHRRSEKLDKDISNTICCNSRSHSQSSINKSKNANKVINEISQSIRDNSKALKNPDEFYNDLFQNIIFNTVKSQGKIKSKIRHKNKSYKIKNDLKNVEENTINNNSYSERNIKEWKRGYSADK